MTDILNPQNRLFVLARQARRQPSAVTAIAAVFVILVLTIASQAATRFVLHLIFPDGIQSVTTSTVENIAGFLPIYLGLWVWLRWSSHRPFWSLGFESHGALPRILKGALVGAVMISITAGLAIVPGVSSARAGSWTALALASGLLGLAGFAVQAPAEEALFRGWLLPVIGSRYRPSIGVLVSALVFSLAHTTNVIGNSDIAALAWLNLFLFGVFAAFYALAEGGLWGIGAWHTIWNWAQGDLLGFALSGSPHQGLLVTVGTSGPNVITGGPFGLEGGLACTAVLLTAIGVLATRSGCARTTDRRPETVQ